MKVSRVDPTLASGPVKNRGFYSVMGISAHPGVAPESIGGLDRRLTPWIYTYDENGKTLTAENDEGLDGEIDWNRIFTYDAEGRLIVQDEFYPVPRDADYNGVPDGLSRVQGRNTYDEQGCPISRI